MIHISKTKKRNFIVANVAKNGEVLKSSEPLESKQACWRNIKSDLLSCYGGGYKYAVVQDNTGKKPKVYQVAEKKVVAFGIDPQTPHVPK